MMILLPKTAYAQPRLAAIVKIGLTSIFAT